METISLDPMSLSHLLEMAAPSPVPLRVATVLLPAPLMTLGTAIGTSFPDSIMATLVPRLRAELGALETSRRVFLGSATEHLVEELLCPTPANLVPLSVPTGLPLLVDAGLVTLSGTAVRPMLSDIAIATCLPRCPSTRVLMPRGLVETTPFPVMALSHVLEEANGTPVMPSASRQLSYPVLMTEYLTPLP